MIERDLTQRHASDPSVEAAWLTIYRAPREHWELYELAEELVDLEDAFRLWRFRHVSTVERIIGFKPGTGGTSGVGLPAQDARGRAVPGAVEGADGSLGRPPICRAGRGRGVTSPAPGPDSGHGIPSLPARSHTMQHLLDALPIWGLFLLVLLVVLISIEVGYRRGRIVQQREVGKQEKEAPVGAMVGATLGLLAFLLAITFSIAEDSFNARKIALLDEANAIRTTYLQTAFIPEPNRDEVRRILRQYVDERLQWTGVPEVRNLQSATTLLDRLWAQVASVGDKARDVATVALFVDSANRVISLNAERVMLRERSRIPRAMDAVLILLTILSFAGMGYHGGVAGTVRSPVMVIVAVSFSLVVMLIADLNRPGQGWINVDQDAMIDLRNSLNGHGQ